MGEIGLHGKFMFGYSHNISILAMLLWQRCEVSWRGCWNSLFSKDSQMFMLKLIQWVPYLWLMVVVIKDISLWFSRFIV